MKKYILISEKRKMMSDGKMKWVIKYPNGTVYTTSDSKRQIENVANSLGYILKIDNKL